MLHYLRKNFQKWMQYEAREHNATRRTERTVRRIVRSAPLRFAPGTAFSNQITSREWARQNAPFYEVVIE